jgi:hypothetical protein
VTRVYATTWVGAPPTTGAVATGALKMRVGSMAPAINNYGMGCGAGPLAIVGTGTGQLNTPVTVHLANGPAGPAPALIWLGFDSGGIYPFDLSTAGYPGCKLYTDFMATFPALVQGGVSNRIQRGIPADKSLVCARFYLQGLAIEIPSMNIEFSDFLRVLIGI